MRVFFFGLLFVFVMISECVLFYEMLFEDFKYNFVFKII